MGYGKQSVSTSRSTSAAYTAGNVLVGFPIHLAVQAYELAFGLCMYVLTKGQAAAEVVHNESKEMSMETAMLLMIRMKDLVSAVIMAYVG